MDKGEIVLYKTEDGLTEVSLRAIDGSAWLTQSDMAELFDTTTQNITLHIKNIYEEGELDQKATCKDYLQVQNEGSRSINRTLKLYNLDAILSVGYRIRSPRGTQFRKWANTVLKEYLVKGFVMDDVRLKQSEKWDYFDEWLARIRDIRASKKRFYQKVRDIYATSVDYDKNSDDAKLFFKKVQNKMLWAVTGKTAAEIIKYRSNPNEPNMALTHWQGSVVRKNDVDIAENYLNIQETEELNRIVVMYLDYAEDQAKKHKTITMAEWAEKLDTFLTFNERDLLTHSGKVRADVAKKLAEDRYEEFDKHRKEVEAIETDEADLKEIEEMVKELKKQNVKQTHNQQL